MNPLNIGSSPSPIPVGAPKSDAAATPGVHSSELKASALNAPVVSRGNLTPAHRSPAVRQFVEGIGEVVIRNLKDLGITQKAKVTGHISRWLAEEFCAVDDRYARKDRHGNVIRRLNGHRVPNEAAAARLLNERMMNRDFPEAVVVALHKSKVLGIASFMEYSNPQFSVLSGPNPMAKLKGWLGDLYVREAYRGKGVGSLLRQAVEQEAAKTTHEMHLFTADQQAFYSKRGWSVLRQEKAGEEPVTIMKKALDTDTTAFVVTTSP
jgi:GNAT superfamily N-acetyltransferase